MTLKTKLFLLASAIILIITVYTLPKIEGELTILLDVIIGSAAVAVIVVTALFCLSVNDYRLTKRAERQMMQANADKATRESQVTIHDSQHGFFVSDLNTQATWQQLDRVPLWRINGHAQEPTALEMQTWLHRNAHLSHTGVTPESHLLPAMTQPLDLLSLLDKAKRVLIHSASEAGKTTLLQHIAARSKSCIIVDPHYQPGKWPGGRVIGKARGFEEIAQFLEWLDTELDRRSQQMAQGETNFVEYTIIVDELSTIRLHCGNDAMRPLAMMIMESAKFGFRLFVGGHSKLVELLGLRGMGDIREGLVMVHLEYNQVTGERRSMVDLGQGPQECYVPPFYQQQAAAPDLVFQPGDNIAKIEEADKDVRFVRLVNEGKSRNAASLEVYGRRYAGDIVERGKRLLGEI